MSKSVVTIIADTEYLELTDVLLQQAQDVVTQAGGKILEIRWLATGKAADVIFTGIDPEVAEEVVHDALKGRPCDAIAQEAGDRQKRLLICDMDSTIITCECIDELADFAGLKPQVSAITERAMNGELDFEDALRERVQLLAELDETVLKQVYEERIRFMPGARELVQRMRESGAYCVLVSGGFTYFTERVAQELGFHDHVGNELIIENGKLTGGVGDPVRDKNTKLQVLMEVCQARGIPLAETLAVGDGANDLPMLMAAGLGVAYHAKPIVQQAARARLNATDLESLVYVQGYEGV